MKGLNGQDIKDCLLGYDGGDCGDGGGLEEEWVFSRVWCAELKGILLPALINSFSLQSRNRSSTTSPARPLQALTSPSKLSRSSAAALISNRYFLVALASLT